MAGVPRREAVLTRRGRLIAGGLGVAAAAVAGFFLHANRLELFVLPARWGKILELEGRARGKPLHEPIAREVHAALETFLELRGLRYPPEEKGMLSLTRARTHEGDAGWLLVHTAERIRFVLLDRRGRPVGDPMPAAKALGTEPWQWHLRVHEELYPFDIFRVNGGEACSDHSVDRRGVIQRGLVLHGLDAMNNPGGPLPVEIPVSTGVSREARHWLLADSRPLASRETIGRLLGSTGEADLFRALYEIERLGARGAGLARPLLAHENPDVRARAAAVLGNDPALGAELAPLLEDPSEKVKMGTLFSLLGASDVGLARKALLELMEKRVHALCSRFIDFDVDRLASPEVVTAVLSWSRGEDAVPLEYLERFVVAFRREHLRPVLPELVRHFKEVQATVATQGDAGRPLDETLRALVWLLAGADAEESDSLLADALSRTVPQESVLDHREQILGALLHRKTALRVADPAASLAKLPDSLWLQSFLLQVWWGFEGAVEQLSGRIHATGTDEWAGATIVEPFSQDRGLEGAFYHVQWALLGTGTSLWQCCTPPALLPLFIDLALEDPDSHSYLAAMVLHAQEPPTLRSIEKDLLQLLEHADSLESASPELFGAAAKSGSQALDPWAAKALDGAPGDRRDEVLWCLLNYRADPVGPVLTKAVEELAMVRGEVPPRRPYDRKAWRTDIIAGPRWWRHWDQTMDPQLAANLLLVRWNVPGARERLLARLREPGNDWILDFLWEAFLPVSLVPDLEDLAARGSTEVADRVEYILSTAAKLDTRPR